MPVPVVISRHAGQVAIVLSANISHTWPVSVAIKTALNLRLPNVSMQLVQSETDWKERLDRRRLIGIVGYLDREAWSRLSQFPHASVVNYASHSAEQLPSVIPDHERIGELAARHLLDCGYRRHVFVYYEQEGFAASRYAGFSRVIQQAGAAVAGVAWSGERIDFLADAELPMGLFCSSDWGARRLCELCVAAGRQLPREFGILGVNNDARLCELAPVPISSVDIDAERLGKRCVEGLCQLLDGGKAWKPARRVPPRAVAQRQSTGEMVFADPDVRRAMHYIREHVGESFHVNDLLDEVTVSRRTLETRFREHLGKSIRKVIEQQRFRLARQLLRDTNLPVGDVAHRCSFKKHSRFTALFHRIVGETPSAYRERFR